MGGGTITYDYLTTDAERKKQEKQQYKHEYYMYRKDALKLINIRNYYKRIGKPIPLEYQ